MGILDKGVSLEEFRQFKSFVERQIGQLDKRIKLKATDFEVSAKEAAESANQHKESVQALATEIESNLESIEKYRLDAKAEFLKIATVQESLESSKQELDDNNKLIKEQLDEISDTKDSIEESSENVFEKIREIDNALEKSESLPSRVDDVESLWDDVKECSDGINGLLKHSMSKKSEIDALHLKIIGDDVTNDEGETEHVDGLVDKLESAYGDIAEKVESLEHVVGDSVESVTQTFGDDLEDLKLSFEKLVSESKSRIKSVNDQLTALLPGAMAEGLSAAYEQKKHDEISYQQAHERTFRIAITILVSISFIPLIVNGYLLAGGEGLVSVIKDTPNLLVAILPLYFPVLWLAYSANKKLNLSKRLIEEYTHKAVLGKTFDGLSNQIDSLHEDYAVVRDELRTKLLFTLLQVSSENPGKLISNYEKSDHPIMDALETSAKLADSVDALAKLPGFGKLANKLAERSKKLTEHQKSKVDSGLDAQQVFE